MLHLVNYKFSDLDSARRCFERLEPGATVLFIESGVFSVRAGSKIASAIESQSADFCIAALEPDLIARGITETDMIHGVQVVNDRGFVDLAVRSRSVCSWFRG